MSLRKLPIVNASADVVALGLEPEGDFVELSPGARCEVWFLFSPELEDDIELEIGGDAVRIYSRASKQVWQNGTRRR